MVAAQEALVEVDLCLCYSECFSMKSPCGISILVQVLNLRWICQDLVQIHVKLYSIPGFRNILKTFVNILGSLRISSKSYMMFFNAYMHFCFVCVGIEQLCFACHKFLAERQCFLLLITCSNWQSSIKYGMAFPECVIYLSLRCERHCYSF